MVKPERRRAALRYLQVQGLRSQRRGCALVEVSRSSLYYVPRRPADEEALRAAIRELAARHRRYGYRRVWALLRRAGWTVNVKRVHRLWKQEGLSLPRKRPSRRAPGPAGEVEQRAEYPNHVWSYDLLEDRTERGGRLRLLSVVDEYTRECLAIEVARRVGAAQVVELLRWLTLTRGRPEHLRSDNGPEFIAQGVRSWLQEQGSSTIFITPGSPWENPYIESFGGKLRDECLNAESFADLQEAQVVVEAWREEYNQRRPHSSLGYLTPAEFAAQARAKQGEGPRGGGLVRATPSLRPHPAWGSGTLSL